MKRQDTVKRWAKAVPDNYRENVLERALSLWKEMHIQRYSALTIMSWVDLFCDRRTWEAANEKRAV